MMCSGPECPIETNSDSMYWCSQDCYRRWADSDALVRQVDEEARIRRGQPRNAPGVS